MQYGLLRTTLQASLNEYKVIVLQSVVSKMLKLIPIKILLFI